MEKPTTRDPDLDEFNEKWANRATRSEAKEIAQRYIQKDLELQSLCVPLSLEELVTLVDIARARGDDEQRIKLDMWLLANFEPQRIVGSMRTGR